MENLYSQHQVLIIFVFKMHFYNCREELAMKIGLTEARIQVIQYFSLIKSLISFARTEPIEAFNYRYGRVLR